MHSSTVMDFYVNSKTSRTSTACNTEDIGSVRRRPVNFIVVDPLETWGISLEAHIISAQNKLVLGGMNGVTNVITSGDLNDYTNFGKYRYTDANAENISNGPNAKGMRFLVFSIYTAIIQVGFQVRSNVQYMYFRVKWDTLEWTGWKSW